eukprot:scaffold1679_cov127-Isochrysis_galbana.AAC.11
MRLGFDGDELIRGVVADFIFLLVALDELELIAEGVGEVLESDLDVFRGGIDAHDDVEERRLN